MTTREPVTQKFTAEMQIYLWLSATAKKGDTKRHDLYRHALHSYLSDPANKSIRLPNKEGDSRLRGHTNVALSPNLAFALAAAKRTHGHRNTRTTIRRALLLYYRQHRHTDPATLGRLARTAIATRIVVPDADSTPPVTLQQNATPYQRIAQEAQRHSGLKLKPAPKGQA